MDKVTIKSVSGLNLNYPEKNKKLLSSSAIQVNVCGLSFDLGKPLKRKTLINHLSPEYWDLISKNQFYFCSNPDCPVIYFNSKVEAYFSQNEVKTQVMHKLPIGYPYRIACYCMGILEQDIIVELLEKQCCESLKDIQQHTKANTGKDCLITNPTGRCCGSEIKKIIVWTQHKKEVEPDAIEEALKCCVNIEENTRFDLNLKPI